MSEDENSALLGPLRWAETYGKTVRLRCERCSRLLARLAPHGGYIDEGLPLVIVTDAKYVRDLRRIVGTQTPGAHLVDRVTFPCHKRCGLVRGERVRPPRIYTYRCELLSLAFVDAIETNRAELVAGDELVAAARRRRAALAAPVPAAAGAGLVVVAREAPLPGDDGRILD